MVVSGSRLLHIIRNKGGPKTYGSYRSGTLTQTRLFPDQRLDTETEKKTENNGRGTYKFNKYGRILVAPKRPDPLKDHRYDG